MYRRFLIGLAAAALTGLTACNNAAVASSGAASTVAAHTAAASTAAAAGRAPASTTGAKAAKARPLRVLIEPAAGLAPIYQLITSARSSVDMTMYELADPTAEADLAADAARGVDVRVILDRHLEKSANTRAYHYLAAHRVHVRWGPAGTTVHQKTITVDNATSAIMTLNLVSADYADTRDFAVIDTSYPDVAAIVATFNADYAGRASAPPDGADLVWSPTNAQAAVLSVIGGAAHTLVVENEEMDDSAVTSALAAAARRGVEVEVIMTADAEWDGAFDKLAAAGVHIRLYADDASALYIHAKVIAADAGRSDQRVLIGSQNFSVASLDYNRELGILTRRPAVIAAVSKALASDYAGATPYRRPKAASPGSASPGSASPGSAGTAAPECTATASVYDAAKDWNNVYVNSNRPDTTATARADGYSHSYETDGSGYALIYLNGPPPGALITVTVGGATCRTSD